MRVSPQPPQTSQYHIPHDSKRADLPRSSSMSDLHQPAAPDAEGAKPFASYTREQFDQMLRNTWDTAMTHIQKNCAVHDSHVAHLTSEHQALSDKVGSLTTQLQQAKTEAGTAGKQNTQQQSTIAQLQKDLAGAEIKANQKNQELQTAGQQLKTALEGQISQLKTDLEEQMKAAESSQRNQQQTISELSGQVKSGSQSVSQARASHAEALGQNEKLTQQLSQTQQELKQAHSTIADLRSQLATESQKNARHGGVVANMQTQIDASSRTSKQLRADHAAIKSDNRKLNETLSKVQGQVSNSQTKEASAQSAMEKMQQAMADMQAQMAQERTQMQTQMQRMTLALEGKDAENHQLRGENHALKNNYTQADTAYQRMSELQGKYRVALEKLEGALDDHKNSWTGNTAGILQLLENSRPADLRRLDPNA